MLKLSKSVSVDGLNGQVINIMSNDVARFDQTVGFLSYLVKGPVELVLMAYFIYREISFYGLIGVGFLLCVIPIQCKYIRLTSYECISSNVTDVCFSIYRKTSSRLSVAHGETNRSASSHYERNHSGHSGHQNVQLGGIVRHYGR